MKAVNDLLMIGPVSEKFSKIDKYFVFYSYFFAGRFGFISC